MLAGNQNQDVKYPYEILSNLILNPVSCTHLDVYKRQYIYTVDSRLSDSRLFDLRPIRPKKKYFEYGTYAVFPIRLLAPSNVIETAVEYIGQQEEGLSLIHI